MLQQQISNAQLQNLAAVQQVKVGFYHFNHVYQCIKVLHQKWKHPTAILLFQLIKTSIKIEFIFTHLEIKALLLLNVLFIGNYEP